MLAAIPRAHCLRTSQRHLATVTFGLMVTGTGMDTAGTGLAAVGHANAPVRSGSAHITTMSVPDTFIARDIGVQETEYREAML